MHRSGSTSPPFSPPSFMAPSSPSTRWLMAELIYLHMSDNVFKLEATQKAMGAVN